MNTLLAAGLFLIATLTAIGATQIAPKMTQGKCVYVFIAMCAAVIEVTSGLILLG
jgi:hypothetical protein